MVKTERQPAEKFYHKQHAGKIWWQKLIDENWAIKIQITKYGGVDGQVVHIGDVNKTDFIL